MNLCIFNKHVVLYKKTKQFTISLQINLLVYYLCRNLKYRLLAQIYS